MTRPPVATDLLTFVDDSPSPYHAVEAVVSRLALAGFVDCSGVEIPPSGGGYVRSGGMLIAWFATDPEPGDPFRIIGAHTDSPNLRIKPKPDLGGSGMRRLAAEPYGGALLNSWLDRDLGLSGRVSVRNPDGTVAERLFRDDRPLFRVPQLAIHLDRDVNEKGLLLNRQQHLHPVWGVGESADGDFAAWLAAEVGVDPDAVLAWDAMCHDTSPAGLLGVDEELISAARLDNLCSCHGAVEALLDVATDGGADGAIVVIALFDHEEVGSETATGAASPQLAIVLDRWHEVLGSSVEDRDRSRTASRILSADMAHGTHPNYPDRHEPNHRVALGGGPVVKVNPNARYASDANTAGEFLAVCRDAGVPTQTYSHRADLACGSTIGPISAARLGIATVDVGMAQLSMHSARELMATADVAHMVDAFSAWLRR